MPELPEVETVKRTLENLIIGKTISSIDVYRDKTLLNDKDEFVNGLIGATITRMSRIGKFLIFHYDNNKVMVSHLRMEGKFFLKNASEKVSKHDLVCFNYTDGTSLRYNDTRRFGIIGLRNEDDYKTTDPVNKVGPEPFVVTEEHLIKAYKGKRIPMKSMLLDQSIMSGLGNIYCDEVLFETHIHPETLACDITPNQIKEIINASVKVLNHAIELGGSTIHSYQSAEGVNGEFQINLKAYGKDGTLCPNCNKETLRRIVVGGRGSTYCPNCQRNVSYPKVIGVTGPVGAGKSTVSSLLAGSKYLLLDADKIVHELYSSSNFTKGMVKSLRLKDVTSNDIIDRKLLREYLIANPDKKAKLEKYVWDAVEDYIKSKLSKLKKDDVVILEVPMLFESKLNYLCDKVVLVTASNEIQMKHLEKRGAATLDLMKINKDYHLEEKLAKADYIIENNGSLKELKNKVSELIKKF
ncbi:MAG: bifunctional DNA-formamidopyrimidine glycosylase/DNA-(apurinic or apyrimidinic site) lyase [Bacilli bacterium]|nr:bifunctional DNA-formamidopyrimidine glycosylase/DNA-(apurinic or apyrimidinic site) lyase [Bacilli bacterium]